MRDRCAVVLAGLALVALCYGFLYCVFSLTGGH